MIFDTHFGKNKKKKEAKQKAQKIQNAKITHVLFDMARYNFSQNKTFNQN